MTRIAVTMNGKLLIAFNSFVEVAFLCLAALDFDGAASSLAEALLGTDEAVRIHGAIKAAIKLLLCLMWVIAFFASRFRNQRRQSGEFLHTSPSVTKSA